MSRKLITAPVNEAVELADAKLHLRVTASDEDSLIGLLTASAREECENEIRRALITQTWEKYLDSFPDAIPLFYPPLQGVNSVKYVDVNGVLQTLANTEYLVDDKQEPAWIVPALGKTWPATSGQINAVIVNFTCGYGDTAAAVPKGIRNWIMMRLTSLYNNRDEVVIGVATIQRPAYLDGLLDRYRVALLA